MASAEEPKSGNSVAGIEGCPRCALVATGDEVDRAGLRLRRSPATLTRLLRSGAPGTGLVVSARHVVEPFELHAGEAAGFFDEVLALARAIAIVCEPVKISYRIGGDAVPHLSCEVVPQYRDEVRGLADDGALLDLGARLRRVLEDPSSAAPLRYEPLGMDDLARLQELCESCADYYHLMTGAPVHPSEASSLYTMRPETAGVHDKFLIAVWRGTRMVGALDVYRHYPARRQAWIGLLLLHPEFRGHGLGTEMITWVLGWARQQGCDRVRVGVAEDNQRALAVLDHLGFVATGERILRVNGARRLVLCPLECRV
jgi:RimJ/RimL family protein N-acetyltransferase/diadenosine tetraphosphate (Ap4A) HIT family hydrolase